MNNCDYYYEFKRKFVDRISYYCDNDIIINFKTHY